MPAYPIQLLGRRVIRHEDMRAAPDGLGQYGVGVRGQGHCSKDNI